MAKHIVEFPLENIELKDYLAYACKASEELGWTVSYISETGIAAESPMSLKKNTWGETITITHSNGFITIKSVSKGNTLIDFGRNRKNIAALTARIDVLRSAGTPPPDQWREVVEENQQLGDNDLLNPESAAAKESKQWWKIFIPSREFLITPLLIDINILLFLLMVITSGSFGTLLSPEIDVLLKWGATYKPAIIEGEWWRLFTAMFGHIGIIHLAMNMYALLFIGIYLEPLLGKFLFSVAYLVTGLTASLVSIWWHDNSVGAGASGAIFGLYGVFLFLLFTNIIDSAVRKSLLPSIGIFVGYNLISGLKAGVDNAAHIGGLLSGVAVGAVFFAALLKRSNKALEKIVAAALVVAVAISVFVIVPKLSNPVGEYTALMENFASHESRALEIYNKKDNQDAQEILNYFKSTTLPGFQLCREEIKKAKQIKNLPEPLKQRLSLLDDYSKLRITESELRIKALTENTDAYDAEIQETEGKIMRIIQSLSS
jgi:rhomboid protease GluP